MHKFMFLSIFPCSKVEEENKQYYRELIPMDM